MNDEPISLLNIGPVTVPVELKIGGQKVNAVVKPVSAEDVIPLIMRFDEFRLLLDNRASEITAARLVKMGPEALGAVLASCLGMTGDANAEAMCRTMGLGNQMKILKAAIPISFPEGIGPFVEDLRTLVGAEENPSTTTQTTASSRDSEAAKAA